MMRVFIGIQIPLSIGKTLHRLARSVAREPGIKLLPPESYHLTLKFFGEVSVHELPAIKHHLHQQVSRFPAFPITVHGIDLFPDRHPRYLVAELKANSRLLDLVRIWPSDRPFVPHVTLIRFKRPVPRSTRDAVVRLKPPAMEFVVQSILLIQSELTATGARYTVLDQVQLMIL